MTNNTKSPNRMRLIILGLAALILAFGAGEMVLNKMGMSLLPVPPEALNRDQAADNGPAKASRHMVSAAHPLAAQAGLDMLRAGGTAVDAAVAVEAVLTLVEPQSSGLGGGAFMLFWNGPDKTLTSYDGREKAPQRADQTLFLDDNGQPMPFFDALVGGRSVGAPGSVAMLWKAHQAHGRLPWAKLFEPAIGIAEKGFPISPRLHKMLVRDPALKYDRFAASYYYRADGTAKPIGTVIKNPAFAATLKKIAEEGPRGFYRGDVAKKIVAAVTGHPRNPGLLTLGDLATYEAKERPPLCGEYRTYIICGMAPPSSGGFTVLQILSLLDGFDLPALIAGSQPSVHLISEASRLAYADRDHYFGDWDFVDIPIAGLLDPDYIASRAAAIDPDRAAGHKRQPGGPEQHSFNPHVVHPTQLSTSHFSIVDEGGNAVSMTASVEAPFGAHIMAGGFILNNQLTDFSFDPEPMGRPHPNRVEGGKRPRSSMSPTMVFDQDWNLKLVIGSPGGNRIIAYVTQTIIGVLDQGLDIQAAITAPRHVNRNGKTELEKGTALEAIAPALSAMGHDVDIREITSGLHGILIAPGDDGARQLTGGADPRREGVALGD